MMTAVEKNNSKKNSKQLGFQCFLQYRLIFNNNKKKMLVLQHLICVMASDPLIPNLKAVVFFNNLSKFSIPFKFFKAI